LTVVAIAGKFDFIHDGHIDHITKASKLGDYLLIITHTDEVVARDSKKGFCAVPLWARKLLLEGLLMKLSIKGGVVVAEPADTDGMVTNTLKLIKPDIFARGGDRTNDNIPQRELDICWEIGCNVIYGVGDLLNSSSNPGRRSNE